MRMDRALHSERFTSDLVFWRLNSVCFISTAFEYEKFGSKNVRNKPLESRQKSGSANPANFAAQKYRNYFFLEGRGAVPGTLTRFYDGDKTAAQSGLGLISA